MQLAMLTYTLGVKSPPKTGGFNSLRNTVGEYPWACKLAMLTHTLGVKIVTTLLIMALVVIMIFVLDWNCWNLGWNGGIFVAVIYFYCP